MVDRETPTPTAKVEIEFEDLVKRQGQPTNLRWRRPPVQGPSAHGESRAAMRSADGPTRAPVHQPSRGPGPVGCLSARERCRVDGTGSSAAVDDRRECDVTWSLALGFTAG